MKPKNSRLFTSRLLYNGLFSLIFFLLLLASTRLHASALESFLIFYSNNILGETEPCG
jgi:hypothetical protein